MTGGSSRRRCDQLKTLEASFAGVRHGGWSSASSRVNVALYPQHAACRTEQERGSAVRHLRVAVQVAADQRIRRSDVSCNADAGVPISRLWPREGSTCISDLGAKGTLRTLRKEDISLSSRCAIRLRGGKGEIGGTISDSLGSRTIVRVRSMS